ncbi:MAG: AAA family ATPase [Campylobacteraceae bacterium]|jgi:MoxR-like ATPase|nr:AAA family ATPase [Campylobacteraceae bacterium]MBT3882759.1 AAA family ATPase [Campylobacteraceae bacterium]MBT4030932.1 AAA family ATPase [Campylobacteraceae bacterium]MBT4179680.1 AAA family ATPase [Campylobacteraceae bacterium]MBT5324453.1 AAA family ATPase [Campylobacteraceae bacterium]
MQNIIKNLKQEISKVVIGQEQMIDSLLIGLFTNGHILLEGVPGLAKTTTVKAMASSLGLNFKRVQFTPDLLPSDIVGAQIYDMKTGDFKIKKGPIFTNLLLADEINRAPAKVQSALLEVMQEYQVTIADESFKIDEPFLVLATQNPIEQEGAYRLPEAQLDRFMFKVVVDYNTKEDELEIARKAAAQTFETISSVITKDEINTISEDIKKVHMDKEVEEYIVSIVHASREPQKYGLEEIKDYIFFGASPRATIDMFKASKAYAYIKGKSYVTPVDIAMIAKDILRHRIILSYEAQANSITTDFIISKILEKVDIP